MCRAMILEGDVGRRVVDYSLNKSYKSIETLLKHKIYG